MPVKNWCYGAKSPELEQAITDAIYAAHQYRNRLCELELAKRERHYEILRRLAPEFLAAELSIRMAEQELLVVRESIQAERVKQRTKTPKGVGQLTARASELKAELRSLRARLKEAKQEAYAYPEVADSIQKNVDQHKAECKAAKESSGLYWGTEAIVRQACGAFASGAPPKFKRFTGEGQLAVQLQGGLDCEDAGVQNTLCYFGETVGKQRECFIRIGSAGREPVFAKVMVVFHRPLPSGKIKWAYLERRLIADHVYWKVRLATDVVAEPHSSQPGEVAIHTGWRMESNGLRVCTLLGSDGNRHVLRLPGWHCNQYLKIDQVKGRRDEKFNEMKSVLAEWMKDRELPEWLAESVTHLHLWRSPARLASLYWKWSENRFDGDEEILGTLNEWRKKDKHAWQHERRLSVRISRRRKYIFRDFVAKLWRQYGVAIVSPIAAKELNENTVPEDLERDNTSAHRHAKWAAVSELTQVIREKFALRCVDVDCRNITRQCCNCGELSDSDSRRVQCVTCGHTHDVDDNAVANILTRGEVAVKNGALLELEAAEKDKAIAAKEKLAKMQEANRAARKKKREAMELAK